MSGQSSNDLLPVRQVAQLEQECANHRWLVEQLWGHQAVGFVAGAPKCCKSWLALDLAVSVASGTDCLDHFPVLQSGPALVYLAEDALPQVRMRIEGIARHRRLKLDALDLHVITSASLRLDLAGDQQKLDATIKLLRPRILVLDPLVRLHRLDENSASDISALLGFLRVLQRSHDLAIVVVHHMSKRARAQLGQSLRGSGDLHAWSDSSAYLVRQRDRIQLTVEHRAAPAPEQIALDLSAEIDGPAHLQILASNHRNAAPPPPLIDAVHRLLSSEERPMTRQIIRSLLRVNNQRLGHALCELEERGLVERSNQGWETTQAQPPATPKRNGTSEPGTVEGEQLELR